MSRLNSLPDPERHPHGTRARYVSGRCRCEPCRAANAAHRRQRARAVAAGDTRGLVSSDRARAHLAALRATGVGARSVSAASDVALSIVRAVASGKATNIRAHTERRILAVDAGAVADHGHVDSGPTRRLIREIIRAGYTRGEIARRLGASRPALQLAPRRILARNALAVERIHRELMAEVSIQREQQALCSECGRSHERAVRVVAIARMAGADTDAIAEAWPCWYGGEKGRALLLTDLSRMRRAA